MGKSSGHLFKGLAAAVLIVVLAAGADSLGWEASSAAAMRGRRLAAAR